MGVGLGESFSWLFSDRLWRLRILLQALILLIPVLGLIALLGWMLANMENLRDGRRELAPNGLYLIQGVEMFAVWLIYSVPALLPWLVLATISANHPRNPTLYGLTEAALLGGLVVLAWLMPAMIVATDRAGFLVGVGPRRLLRESVGNVRTLPAAAVLVVAFAIGLVGVFFFLAGFLLTFVYATTAVAAVAAWWERPLQKARWRAAGAGESRPAVGPEPAAAEPAAPATADPGDRPPAPWAGLGPLRTVVPPAAILRPPDWQEPEADGPPGV